MKKTDILYLILGMLIVYGFLRIFVVKEPFIKDIEPPSEEKAIIIENEEEPEKNISYITQDQIYDYLENDPAIEVHNEPSINARSAIVMDFETGAVLYQKNAFRKRPMASTTKIMTAIIALENCDLNEDVVISQKAANMGGSSMGIRAGSVVKMNDLLHGMLICSGNDAAVAIAEHIGGSIEGFSELMNKKALEIGAFSTSFSNPHGLDEDDHYTTAYDLAKITRYALKIPEFNDIVKKKEFFLKGGPLKAPMKCSPYMRELMV